MVVLLALAGAGLTTYAVYEYMTAQQQAIARAQEIATEQLAAAAKRLDQGLLALVQPAQTLADDLEQGRVSPADLPARLRQDLAKVAVFEVGVAYAPFALGPGTRLYAPHAVRRGGQIDNFRLEQRYDYTGYDWFKSAMEHGASWSEPYQGHATGALVLGISLPFRKPGNSDGPPDGVVRVNLSVDEVRRLVADVSLTSTGYGFLLSRRGTYLADPEEEYVRLLRSIFDVADQLNDEARRKIGERAVQGKRGIASGKTSAGQPFWILCEPVPSAGWSLGMVLPEEEFAPQPDQQRRDRLLICYCLMICLGACLMLVGKVHLATPRRLAACATGLSVILIGGICFTWLTILRVPDRDAERNVRITTPSALQQFLKVRSLLHTRGRVVPPIPIPTGVLWQTARLVSASDILVTGYAWQQYPKHLEGRFQPGLSLPQAEAVEWKDAYRREDGDTVVVGFSFKATLRQQFENSLRYPFDRTTIKMQLWPRDFDREFILVPNLDAYRQTNPGALPGLSPSLSMPGWELTASYFSVTTRAVPTDFGIGGFVEQAGKPELAFNLVLQRKFLDPFISTLLPIFVVAGLLFALLMAGTKNRERMALTGFKATDIVRAGATLLFPIILAQINLRSKISASGIIYLEYLYFIMYAVIMCVSANAITFTLSDRGLAHYRDNLIAKLLFWPVVLGAFFAVTVIFLY